MREPSPAILYGTAWKKERTAALVREAIRQGFRGIDTACQPKHYDEAGVGAGVAACLGNGLSRAELYLQTKFTPVDGHDPKRIPYDPRAPLAEQVAQSFGASLANLRTDYVDALLLHSPLPADPLLAVWQAMEKIADAGAARSLGICNCYDASVLASLYAGTRVKPEIVQNRFYAATGYDAAIRSFCRSHGIAYQSFWTLTANAELLRHDALLAIAGRHARTPAQVLFRYLTQNGVVPLSGTTSIAHMQEDLAVFEFELTPPERATLDGVIEGDRPAR